MIEVNAKTGADGTLASIAKQHVPEATGGVGRIGERQPWGDVLIVPGPVRLAGVGLPGKSEGQVGLDHMAQIRLIAPSLKPLIHVNRGGDLVALALKRRLQQGVAGSVGEN